MGSFLLAVQKALGDGGSVGRKVQQRESLSGLPSKARNRVKPLKIVLQSYLQAAAKRSRGKQFARNFRRRATADAINKFHPSQHGKDSRFHRRRVYYKV